jgi:hypothetical protein
VKDIRRIRTHITFAVSSTIALLDAFPVSRKAFDRRAGARGELRRWTTVCALVFVEYEVTYRIHYRTGVRSMHAKAEKQAQLESAMC